MSRRKKLPDHTWEVIHEKLEILTAYDYQVEPLSDYQFRINGTIDIYPVNKRWHNIRSGKRGTYNELVSFIQSTL
jgi:hypothetical protein